VCGTDSRLTFVSPLAAPAEDTAASDARMSSSVMTEHGSMLAGVLPDAAAAGATAAAGAASALVAAGLAAVAWGGCVAADGGALLTVGDPPLQPTTRLSVVAANVDQNRSRVRARGNPRILVSPSPSSAASNQAAVQV
jgi:hypothetical protein